MKPEIKQSDTVPAAAETIPYLHELLGSHPSARDRKIGIHVANGLTDEDAAKLVGCSARNVRRFRERFGIPSQRERAMLRSMPFSAVQSCGFLGNTWFVTAVVRRLPGAKIDELGSDAKLFQSFSGASETTLSLARLEEHFIRALDATVTGFDALCKAIDQSLSMHAEIKKLVGAPANAEANERDRPVSLILVAGEMAEALEKRLNTSGIQTNLLVHTLNTIRDIIGYLDCSVLSLYSSRLWLGSSEIESRGAVGLATNPPLLNCSLSAAEILRMIDSQTCPIENTLPGSGVALNPPGLHIRQFARRDGFLLYGRRDRHPLVYTSKPWALDEAAVGKPSAAYALPYDLPKSLSPFSAPEWLQEMPNGIQSLERDGKRYIVAREDRLVAAVAKAVRSRSFADALKEALRRQPAQGSPLLAPWCGSFSGSAETDRQQSEEEIGLTAIYALMNFDVDFLMRHFDQKGRNLVEGIESKWKDLLATSMVKFSWRLRGKAGEAGKSAVLKFCATHERPVRYMLLTARRCAERICAEHVRRSEGTLKTKLESVSDGLRLSQAMEREKITSILRDIGLCAGFAVSENDMRNHFTGYAMTCGWGEINREWKRLNEAIKHHSEGKASPHNGRIDSDHNDRDYGMGGMWDNETTYKDD